MTTHLPVVYVRGYAGTTSGINSQVDDPFYGFNLGSTHVRVGGQGDPIFYQFESPLLRLMMDEGYKLLVKGSQEDLLDAAAPGSLSAEKATIWIHRFYDVSASTWGENPEDFRLEDAAENLLTLIEKLQEKTGARAVHLVAHSMGGLICRCLIQKIIPEKRPEKKATDFVETLFTYATPHGGIEFDIGFGMIERVRDTFGIGGADVFGPRRMYSYLTPAPKESPPDDWRPNEMPGDDNFPLERMFCLIGTNPADYGAAFGLSSKAVGAKSDGLVQIENAYVPGANNAFVHRSHSGRYGIVNSEEGYQNLRRFLFGDVKVTAELINLRLPLQEGPEIVWQAEVQVAIRGLPILMHDRVAAHYCPIQLEFGPDQDTADRPVPLVTTFLNTRLRTQNSEGPMRFSLHLRILSLRERGGIFGFGDHIEQAADFDDVLVVDVEPQDGIFRAWANWNSEIPGTLRDYKPSGDPLSDQNPATGEWESRIPLPENAREFLGQEAAVYLAAKART
jgi:Putative serine esterase (DUF676)